jgi:hypothetical protein
LVSGGKPEGKAALGAGRIVDEDFTRAQSDALPQRLGGALGRD